MADEPKAPETQNKPEEGKKKRRGRPPGSGKKAKAPKTQDVGSMYILGTGDPLECEPKIVKGENLTDSIKEFAEQVEIKPDDVFIYEVGQKVTVKTEISITPAE